MKTVKFPTTYDYAGLCEWAMACERDFDRRLSELSRRIVQEEKSYIALSGPSCSGKTTTSHKLVADLVQSGKRVKVVSLDDFYLPREFLLTRAAENGGKIDFDSPSTLDWECLSSFIEATRCSKVSSLPCYNFQKGERVGFVSVDPSEYDLVLFEGIQAAYAEFLSMLPQGNYSAVFVSVESGLKIGSHFLRPRQHRLARRIVRDQRFRGASPEFTLQLWETVTSNEDAFIFPSAPSAHFKLDSLIGYELCVLRDPLLDAIGHLPEGAMTADLLRLAEFCEQVPSLPIEIVPENALLREFIG